MKFSGSQYYVDEATYVLEKEEKGNKVIGRFKKVEHRFMDRLGSIFLEYSATTSRGPGKQFTMYLCDGRHIIDPHDKNVVRTESGHVSLHKKRQNKDYEGKVKSMIDEALRLSQKK